MITVFSAEIPIIEPINFINITQAEMQAGYFYSYCTSKVRDLRLQNVSGSLYFPVSFCKIFFLAGYYFVADDSIFNIWYDLPLENVIHPNAISLDPANWWEPWTAVKAVMLFEEKYKDDEAIQKTWRKYDERVGFGYLNRIPEYRIV